MFPWILCGVLIILVVLLVIKILFLKKGIHDVCISFREHLSSDTNTLIFVSSGDRQIKKLAAQINVQLRQLRKERLRFQNGDRELKEAVTNISHDLRTPLTAICGYLDLLKHEDKNETVQRYLAQIEERTDTMKSLTEELFRYSMIHAEKALSPERLNLCRVLEDNLLSFYGVMQEKGIVPQISLPEEPVWSVLDKAALNRIFSNIINNAVKYSDGDLVVKLTTEGTITFSNTAKDLTSVEVGRLFDRFYTVESAKSSTGLGLSIAKMLTEKCAGNIAAEYHDDQLQIKLQLRTEDASDG